MKGLLLKDLYMIGKYCRMYFVIAAVFIAVSLVGNDNMFFVFYPCLLCGMIPVNLIAYDERSRFVQYSGTLPYTKAQIVSAKYLIGLIFQTATLLITGIAQAFKMSANGSFVTADFLVLMLCMLSMATVTSSICLPFIFKLGAEKGRTAYLVTIGFIGAVIMTYGLSGGRLGVKVNANLTFGILGLAGVCLYILSWCLSISFYKKREI